MKISQLTESLERKLESYAEPDTPETKVLNESVDLKEAPVYDLSPQKVDSRKSFYSKARVDDDGHTKMLYSYNTPVARIFGGKAELLPNWDSSATTLRHVKEFLAQNDFPIGSKSEMIKMYESWEPEEEEIEESVELEERKIGNKRSGGQSNFDKLMRALGESVESLEEAVVRPDKKIKKFSNKPGTAAYQSNELRLKREGLYRKLCNLDEDFEITEENIDHEAVTDVAMSHAVDHDRIVAELLKKPYTGLEEY